MSVRGTFPGVRWLREKEECIHAAKAAFPIIRNVALGSLATLHMFQTTVGRVSCGSPGGSLRPPSRSRQWAWPDVRLVALPRVENVPARGCPFGKRLPVPSPAIQLRHQPYGTSRDVNGPAGMQATTPQDGEDVSWGSEPGSKRNSVALP